ncbi:hypothetical protein BDY19DRAFT_350581 [Irpex rosettiformis]|uniref:Uncharacterized protein n=1 Tax=Irpex rosettiformis TaxID=378272 RepID=A0ACB8TWV7_9APHY|nr:hypothetical protein BDY19DRAFT_350581 [Irpex rosettiformis]
MVCSSPKFAPTYGKFPTPVDELRVGDVFWYRVAVDAEDVADHTSETAKDVRNNRRTKRLVVVICTSPLLVLYLATFNRATTLPNTLLDQSVWYPVDEARSPNCVHFLPLETEPRQTFAQWVNIRRLYVVGDNLVERIGGFHFPERAIEQLINALMFRMKAEVIQFQMSLVLSAYRVSYSRV